MSATRKPAPSDLARPHDGHWVMSEFYETVPTATFHVLVDTLYVQIKQSNYTPTELREACHLAACMYEDRHIRPMFYDPKRTFEWNLKP